jgi:hypothetical protein
MESPDPELGTPTQHKGRDYSMSFDLGQPWLPPTMDAGEGEDQVAGQRRPKTPASSSYTA